MTTKIIIIPSPKMRNNYLRIAKNKKTKLKMNGSIIIIISIIQCLNYYSDNNSIYKTGSGIDIKRILTTLLIK